MKKEYINWIIVTAIGLIATGLAMITALTSMSKTLTALLMVIICASIAATLVLLFKHGSQLQAIAHSISVGSQIKLTSHYPAGSILKDIGTATESFLDETNRKVKTLQNENRDVTLQLQLLNRRKDSIEAVLNSIYDAVIVTDDRDRVILANKAAEKIFGFEFSREEIRLAEDMIESNELVWMISKSRTSRTAHVRHELTFEDADQPVTYDTVLSCVEDDNGEVLQVVTVLHDITREKEIAQMKNDFVSHVSHELKTPLASINAYAEMLVDGEAEDTETIKQFCDVIQSQAQRLSRLIEDILNISRIESGLVKVSKEDHSLALVIRDAVEMITSYAQEKDITVQSPTPILYDQVNIDRDMISQVVINLLSNAVKYTTTGGQITVNSVLNEVEGQVTVSITDTGVGIPPEDVNHVFDKFYRVKANNKYAKGTGLGLNLVKQIVETVHGGLVFVTSTPGEGSTFGFVLPLAKETAAQGV
ncbi:MAG: sensor histidine kinase [Planctomycetota bacterium]|jgi:two-component system phosphate regulon sensor histidine kinase PhoR